jgi:hypothetical protein
MYSPPESECQILTQVENWVSTLATKVWKIENTSALERRK